MSTLVKPRHQEMNALTEGKPLRELLNMIEAAESSITVVVRQQDRMGRIQFALGIPVTAEFGQVHGEEAVIEILSWEDAQITLQTEPVRNDVLIITSLKKLLNSQKSVLQPVSASKSINMSLSNGPGKPLALPSNLICETPSKTPEKKPILKEVSEKSVSSRAVSSLQATHSSDQGASMSNVAVASNVKEILAQCLQIEGALGVAIVDYTSGMALGTQGSGLNLNVAAAGNTNVVRSKMAVMKDLGLQDQIEDILITLGRQYHLIRMSPKHGTLFFYLALDKDKANLAMARHKLTSLANALSI